MSTGKRVIKNTIFLYIRMVVSLIVSIFTTRILLQALGVSDYGIYNVVAGSLSMMGFLSASLSSSTMRFISFTEGEGNILKKRVVFTSALLMHWLMAAVVCVILFMAGFFFFNGVLNIPDGRDSTAMIVYMCLIVSTVFSITVTPYDAILNAHENMLYYSLMGVLDVIMKFLIAVAIYCSSLDRLFFYSILMAVESILLLIITRWYCSHQYQECKNVKFTRYTDRKVIKEMKSFAGWNMLNIGSGMISLFGMNVVVNHYFGTLLNAAMGISSQLAGVMLGVSSNMTKALTPVLMKNEGKRNRSQSLKLSYLGCKFSYLLFSFFCIPVLFYTSFVLELWLVEVPEWTVLFCRLMIVSCLLDQLFVFLHQSIMAQGNVRNYNITRSVFNILPIIITLLQYENNWPPYYVLLNWILFKVIIGGFVNLFYAHQNIGLSIVGWVKDVFMPCISITLISCLLCHYSLLISGGVMIQLSKIMIIFIVSFFVYLTLALSHNERTVIFSLIYRRNETH